MFRAYSFYITTLRRYPRYTTRFSLNSNNKSVGDNGHVFRLNFTHSLLNLYQANYSVIEEKKPYNFKISQWLGAAEVTTQWRRKKFEYVNAKTGVRIYGNVGMFTTNMKRLVLYLFRHGMPPNITRARLYGPSIGFCMSSFPRRRRPRR